MISFFLTLRRFAQSFARGLKDREFRAIFILLVVMLTSGTAFYSVEEGWGVIDSLYFSVITLATVGYGDMHPTTSLSKLFTIFYILVGIGVLMVFIQKLAANAVRRRGGKDSGEGERRGRWPAHHRKEPDAQRKGGADESGRKSRRKKR